MTEWHIEATPDLLAWLDRVPPRIQAQLPVAVFDTRYRISNRYSGSAAHAISKEMEIQGRGGLLVAPPKSFEWPTGRGHSKLGRRSALPSLPPPLFRRGEREKLTPLPRIGERARGSGGNIISKRRPWIVARRTSHIARMLAVAACDLRPESIMFNQR
jgi:hypothetical protein